MHVTIRTSEGSIVLGTTDAEPRTGRLVPCHRCGVCCERWQPLLTQADAERLAAHLGLPMREFLSSYTDPYPFDDVDRLLRQEQGRCVFLRYEEAGRALCTVHAARPAACRDWAAGLNKRECRAGLERLAPAGMIALEDLYPQKQDQEAFVRAARL